MTISANYPSIRPTLLLDFANSKVLDPRITFSRPTTATYYDGKTVAKAEENLILQSQALATSPWGAGGATATNNTVSAPDGTTTATTLTATAGTSTTPNTLQTRSGVIPANTPFTISAYVKANTQNFVSLIAAGSAGSDWFEATVNLSTGAITKTGAGTFSANTTYISSSITSVGNSWYRIAVTGTLSAAFNFAIVEINSNATPTYGTYGFEVWNPVGTESVYLWGAQLEQRSSVTAYTATTTAPITNYIPVLQTAAAGVARFEHNPTTGESLGLEIEEQRTNLVTYSEQYDNAAWSKSNTSITANTIIAPDGTLTGDKLVENSSLAFHNATQSVVGVNPTFSVYAKAGERSQLAVFIGGVSVGVGFDLTAGTVITISGYTTGSSTNTITAVGNGWYRCTVAFSGTTAFVQLGMGLSGAGNYTGNGFAGLYIWGAQLEAGAFATSYIPTVASQVTRSADSASMTGTNFSSWYNASQGTIYGESQAVGTGVQAVTATISSNNDNNIFLTTGSSAFFTGFAGYTNGTLQFNLTDSRTKTSYTKVAGSLIVNNALSAVDGTSVGSDTSVLIPNVTQLLIGANRAGTINSIYIKKLAYYPIAVTSTNLVALTGS
jgi:hypothetical protein